MRRMLIGTALLAVLLVSCGGPAQPEAFEVTVVNQSTDEIYGIHYEYYLDGEPVGGGDIQNADGSLIGADQSLTRGFSSEDFPKGASWSRFALELFVICGPMRECAAGKPLELEARPGEGCRIALRGNRTDGFYCERLGDASGEDAQ